MRRSGADNLPLTRRHIRPRMDVNKWTGTYYKIILANSIMALTVIWTLLFFRTALVAGAVVAGCGITNALLVRAALQVEHQRNHQRQLLARTLNESEKERARIARQLQDDAGQRLAALMLSARGNAAVSSEAAAVMKELYETAQTLDPPGLRHLGLSGALGWYVRSLERRFAVRVNLAVDTRLQQLEESLALAMFRILEDVLENTSERARGWIDVYLAKGNSKAHVYIATGVLTSTERFRLAERTAVLGGDTKVSDRDDQSIVTLTIPLVEKIDAGHDSRFAG